jgi:alpha-D-xyloside xylohydrolase
MKVIRADRLPDRLDIKTDTGLLRLQVIDERIIHVLYTCQNSFSDAPSLMVLPQTKGRPAWDFKEDLDYITLNTARLCLRIVKQTGAFTWMDSNGELLVREPERGGKILREIEINGRKAFSTKLELVFSAGEAIYGLGQHEDGVLNYRGHSEMLYQHNLKVAMPVMVSTRGYALLFDSYSLGNFHDDQYGSYFWSEVEDELDFYFLYGPEVDDLVAGIRTLTGAPSMLPKWAYGYVQSKESYKRQSELVEIVQEYRRRGIGLDCIVQDWLSWPGDKWGQKTLDPERFPDPDKLTRDLHDLHTHLMVSVWPRLKNDGPDQVEFRQHGFLLGDDVTYDAFNPQARAMYWKQANEGLFQHGVDAWWCDCTEPFEPDWAGPVKPEAWERMVINSKVFKQYLDPERINAYSLLHSQGMYEGQRAVTSEKRVINLTRSCYPGQVRYGTITWSGDITARWETLKKQIPAGLNFTITGSPRWTFDIGAFFVAQRSEHWFWDGAFRDGYDDRGYRELFVRWFQMGAFLPMFRAHGTDTPREVWRFGKPGEAAYDTLVKFIRLRYRLLPYIYALAARETQHNYTMLRALAFDFRDDPQVYNIADQFMLGPALMICPVTEPMYYGPHGEAIENQPHDRSVYLPAGSSWYNFWTGKRYSGGQIIRTPAPLEIVPLFVRTGSILPMGAHIQYTGEKPGAPIELRVYPGQNGRFDLYDDEGDSYRCEQGEFAWTPITWDDATRTLRIGPRQGSYTGMPERQVFRIVMAGSGVEPGEAAGEVSISGQESAQWTAK